MWPSSLGVKILFVAGLTAAVLMHHSRTAYGNSVERAFVVGRGTDDGHHFTHLHQARGRLRGHRSG